MLIGIVAIEQSQGIGFNNSMPWPHLKGDLSFFKKQTTNNVVIMGSATFKSLNLKPLPNRINVVLSRSTPYPTADHTFSNHESAISFCSTEYLDKDIYIIGGSEIYKIYMDYIDKFYVTEIDESFNCDKFFDMSYIKKNFINTKEILKFNDPINYTIKEYKR